MSRNIEIKARLSEAEYDFIFAKCEQIADSGPTHLHQHDTFFVSRDGRLKLREFGSPQHGESQTAELIFYRRPNQTGPKLSDYSLIPCSTPEKLKSALTATNGIVGEVKKVRTLFLIGQTRVHLDEVESLGRFIELEVVLQDDQSSEHGTTEASRLMNELQLSSESLLDRAYIDLLASD